MATRPASRTGHEQRLCDALGELAVGLSGHIALHGVHHDVHNAAAGLELGDRKGVFGIEEGDDRADGLRGDALLDPGRHEVVGDDVRVGHLTAGRCDGQHRTDRENLVRFGMGAGRGILPRVVAGRKADANGLGRVDDAAAADGQDKVDLFLPAQRDALMDEGQLGVGAGRRPSST